MAEYPLDLPDSLPEFSALKYLGEREKSWVRNYYRMLPKLPVMTSPEQFDRLQFKYQPRTINSDLAPLIKVFEPPLVIAAGILSDDIKTGFPPKDDPTQLKREAGFGFAKLLGIMESMVVGGIHWREPIWYTIDNDILVKRTEFNARPDHFRMEFFPRFSQLVLRWNQFHSKDFDNLMTLDYSLTSEFRFRLMRHDKVSGDFQLLPHANRLTRPGIPPPKDRNFGRIWGYNPDGSNVRINIAHGNYHQLVDLEKSFMRSLNVSFMYHQPDFTPPASEILFNADR